MKETNHDVVNLALFVRLEAKAGRETEVENFLRGALSLVNKEPATITWFGIRMGPSTFGIFDAFPDESGRQAHLSGQVAAELACRQPVAREHRLEGEQGRQVLGAGVAQAGRWHGGSLSKARAKAHAFARRPPPRPP